MDRSYTLKLPKSVDVFGQFILVTRKSGLLNKTDPEHGYFQNGEIVVGINKDPSIELQTLIHEMGHALWERLSLNQTDIHPDIQEILCDVYATMMVENFDIKIRG